MSKLFRFGLFLTSLSVAINAMGYHALKPNLSLSQLTMFETASRYLVWGAIWIMILGIAEMNFKLPKMALNFIITGLFLFCGSLFLYLLIPLKFFMFLTPLGGFSLIIGFALASAKKK